MKQLLSTAEGPRVLDVASPLLEPGTVLVEVEWSLISTGTELSTVQGVRRHSEGVVQQVVRDPGKIERLAKLLAEHGVRKTIDRVADYLTVRQQAQERLVPLGYSCAGRVAATGPDVDGLRPGDRVACAGAGRATHSELIVVPTPLLTRIPEGCPPPEAAGVAVGAIALQAVRRTAPEIGETVAVLGLGLVGLTACQILSASGARLIGFDLDPARVDDAEAIGLKHAFSDPPHALDRVRAITGGRGVDAALVTAGSEGSEVTRSAVEMVRERGRVVVVGRVGMNLNQDPFLRKEIDVRASRSYGPGRYDDRYEERGLDYPFAYVRWTEGRNMETYLDLVADGRVALEPLLESVPLDEAPDAYRRLREADPRPVGFLIEYRGEKSLEEKVQPSHRLRASGADGRSGVAVVGAGQFVQRVHLPELAALDSDVELVAVLNRTGAKAEQVARQFDASYATTQYEEILKDPDVDVVLIGTRHDLHAEMTGQALRAGKHVLVEKPLAMTWEEHRELADLIDEEREDLPLLLTGFNRRFSPLVRDLQERIRNRSTPLMATYEMNAGSLPPGHWLNEPEGGGRNIGEACHIYDLFVSLVESPVVGVEATGLGGGGDAHRADENFTATLRFEDGSVCTLTYTSLGTKGYPKEHLTVYADGAAHVLEDYLSLESWGTGDRRIELREKDKGHAVELREFLEAIREGEASPIPVSEQLTATRLALEIQDRLEGGADL